MWLALALASPWGLEFSWRLARRHKKLDRHFSCQTMSRNATETHRTIVNNVSSMRGRLSHAGCESGQLVVEGA